MKVYIFVLALLLSPTLLFADETTGRVALRRKTVEITDEQKELKKPRLLKAGVGYYGSKKEAYKILDYYGGYPFSEGKRSKAKKEVGGGYYGKGKGGKKEVGGGYYYGEGKRSKAKKEVGFYYGGYYDKKDLSFRYLF